MSPGTYALLTTIADGALRLTGMRDRLRCRTCGSVGTLKPHGTIFDREDVRCVPRWLCKWCGVYEDAAGSRQCGINSEKGYWDFRDGGEPYSTPRERVAGADPWRG